MANLYGPMQYRPNPSGLTLNSQPRPQFQAPAPVAAPQQPAIPTILPYREWQRQQARGIRRLPIHGDRGSRNDARPYGSSMDDYNSYRLDMLTGTGAGAVRAPVQGVLGLDNTAAAYANFLNGGV